MVEIKDIVVGAKIKVSGEAAVYTIEVMVTSEFPGGVTGVRFMASNDGVIRSASIFSGEENSFEMVNE